MQRTRSTTSKAAESIHVSDLEDVVASIQLGLKQVEESVAQLDTIRRGRAEQIKKEEAAAHKLSDELIAKIDGLYSEMDVDGDEQLSKREAREFFKQFGTLAVSLFEEADEDGDGGISPAEWRGFWQQLANNGYSEEGIAKELADFDKLKQRHSSLPSFVSSSGKASMKRVVRLKMLRVHDAWLQPDEDSALECYHSLFNRSAKATKVQRGRRSLLSVLDNGFTGEPRQKKVPVRMTMKNGGQQGNRAQSSEDDMGSDGCKTMHPSSKLRLTWDFLSTLMVLWDLILLPVSLLISDVLLSPEYDRNVSLFTACFWSVDVLVSCGTGYDAGTRIERDPRAVLRHYLRTWLVLDLVVVIVEWVSFVVEQTGAAGGALRTSRTFRLLRFSRIIRMFRLIKLQKSLNKVDEITNSIRLQILMGILKLSFVLFFLVHLLACGWFAVGGTDPVDGWVVGGMDNESPYQDEGTWTKYIASFRWTLAQVNGRTDLKKRNPQEMIYTGACAVFAIMFMSYFVGSMTASMMEFQNLLSKERGYLRVLNTYAEVHELSWSTVHLCKRYIKDHLMFSKEIDAEKQLLAVLPPQTVIDLLNEVRLAPVCKHQLFYFMVHVHDSGFNAAVRDILSQAAFSDTTRCMELVFAKGNVGDRMLFVESGMLLYCTNHHYTNWMTEQFLELEEKQGQISMDSLKNLCSFLSRRKADGLKDIVKTPDHSQIRHVSPGSYLCEAALWTKTWATRGDLLSVKHCKLVSLRCDKFVEIVQTHGEDVLNCLSFYAQCYNIQLRKLIEQEEESDLIEVNLRATLGLAAGVTPLQADRGDKEDKEDTESEEEDFELADPFASLQSRDSDSEIEVGQGPKELSSIVPSADVGERTANVNGHDYKASL